MIRFIAHFDGQGLVPDEQVKLPTGKPLQVTVEEIAAPSGRPDEGFGQWLDRLEDQVGLVDAPEDWSAELDHYLFGADKRVNPHGD